MRSSGEVSDPRSQLLLFPHGCHSLPVWLNTSSNLFQVSHLCNGNNNYFISLLWKLNELVHIKHLHKCWECSEQHGNVGCYYTIIITIIILSHSGWTLQCFVWMTRCGEDVGTRQRSSQPTPFNSSFGIFNSFSTATTLI